MRVTILAVGRLRSGPERALFDHYAHRFDWPVTVREVEERRPLPASDRKRREGDLLLAARPAEATLVALDAGGRMLTSEAFAARIASWRDAGAAHLAFAIGGADGLDPRVTGAAALILSLGPMTWPHLLVRGLLAEQLFRAHAILSGHPYHRG